MHPGFDPNEKPPPPNLDPTGRGLAAPDRRPVRGPGGVDEDALTFADYATIWAALGCALFVRLLIVLGAIGVLIGVVYVLSHVL